MLEECGLPYEIKPVNIGKGDQFKPEFLAIAPTTACRPSSIPTDRAASRSRSSSPAPSCSISAARPASSIPPTSARRVEVEQWLFWQMADLGPDGRAGHHFRNYAPEKVPYAIDRYTNEVHRLYGVHEHAAPGSRLPRRRIFDRRHGELPLAALCKNLGQDIAEFPALERWFKRIHDRPAVAKAVEVGEELRARLQPCHRQGGAEDPVRPAGALSARQLPATSVKLLPPLVPAINVNV